MSLIYKPSGKAREYSPLALNPYSGGCDHGCTYCYCASIQRGNWGRTPHPRNLKGLQKEAQKADKQILLSFISDPYNGLESQYRATRKALQTLSHAGCSVAILSKGGKRCLADLSLFTAWPEKRIKVGATLTFVTDKLRQEYEPGSCNTEERLDVLRELHNAGIQTWASIEPVIDAHESLAVIETSLEFVDGYKVGKLNHRQSDTDWSKFCMAAVSLIRSAGKKLYVKNDLRPFAPKGFLTPDECNCDYMCLPERPLNDLFKS